MFSINPLDLKTLLEAKANVDKEFLRLAIMAELDAVNFYEQIALATSNEDIRKVMLSVAREEKTHVGEFQAMLLRMDDEQVRELEGGASEVAEITGA
ncbi:MAG: rubrerythrin [Actinomycetota bacterium]|nr:rubrerythrin [Actinomycetota bacterium]